jgi:hypothetical protein
VLPSVESLDVSAGAICCWCARPVVASAGGAVAVVAGGGVAVHHPNETGALPVEVVATASMRGGMSPTSARQPTSFTANTLEQPAFSIPLLSAVFLAHATHAAAVVVLLSCMP